MSKERELLVHALDRLKHINFEDDHLTNDLIQTIQKYFTQPERKSFSDEEITKAFTKSVFGTWDSKSYRSGFKDAEKVHGIGGEE